MGGVGVGSTKRVHAMMHADCYLRASGCARMHGCWTQLQCGRKS